jgi:hypothetical protein
MPLHLYEGLSGRLRTTILQAKRFSGPQRRAVLTRLVQRRRHAWPDPLLMVRGDRHFASPAVMPGIEDHPDRSDVTGLTSHAVLQE